MRHAAALVAVLAVPLLATAAEPARRNVVLLIADDLGMQVGCYGDKTIKTPAIDALAARGTRFSNGFATVSSCSPSRACIYSGLYTHQSGQYGLAHAEHNVRSRDTIKTLPALAKEAGYRAGIIAKVHVAPDAVYPFEVEPVKGPGAGRNSAAIAAAAEKFISDSGDKPFVLVVGFNDPHRAAKGFANDQTYPGVKETKYDPKDVIIPYHLPDSPECREELAEYYQSISRMDLGVGLITEALKKSGHADDTLVIFLSDNGIPWPGAKTTLYDAGIHLPLVIASPGQKKHGVVCDAMASYVDILPTILDWAGIKPPTGLPGRSLLPVLDEEKPQGWDVVYGSHQFHEITMYYPMRCIRTRTHKYIVNIADPLEFPSASDLWGSLTWQGVLKRGDKMMGERSVEAFLHRPHEELYDITADPHELKNLAGDPKSAEVLADFRKQMRSWQEKTKDPWAIKYQHE